MSARDYFKMLHGLRWSHHSHTCSAHSGKPAEWNHSPRNCFTLLILAEMKFSAHVISYSCLKLFFNLATTKVMDNHTEL